MKRAFAVPVGGGLMIVYTRWEMVPLGLRLAAPELTNRPVEAERFTVVQLLVPGPTRSVTVLPGHLAVVALETNRPVRADLFTDLAMLGLLVIRRE